MSSWIPEVERIKSSLPLEYSAASALNVCVINTLDYEDSFVQTERTIRTVVASAPCDSCLAILVTFFHALPCTKEEWFELFRCHRDGAITHLCEEGLVVLIYNSKPARTHIELIDIMESPLNHGSVLFGGVSASSSCVCGVQNRRK